MGIPNDGDLDWDPASDGMDRHGHHRAESFTFTCGRYEDIDSGFGADELSDGW